jgi:hypothetical protein
MAVRLTNLDRLPGTDEYALATRSQKLTDTYTSLLANWPVSGGSTDANSYKCS